MLQLQKRSNILSKINDIFLDICNQIKWLLYDICTRIHTDTKLCKIE